jgi:flagellar biosynthesis GTPase FlhF
MTQQLHRIRGRSLDRALERVRTRFGPEAMIQETREVEVRRENSLGVEKVFEILVLDEETVTGEARNSPSPDGERVSEGEPAAEELKVISRLRKQITSLEKLNARCSSIQEKLTRAVSGRTDYPIYDLLISKGVFPGIANMIMDEYFSQIDSEAQVSAADAIDHIRRNLKTVDTSSWEEIEGVHFFVGGAGSGKTTMVTKLAGRLSERGEETRIVSLFPGNLRDLGGYEIFDGNPAVEVVIAADLTELDYFLDLWKGQRIFIDTPCVLSENRMKTDRFRDYVKNLENAHMNYLFDVSAGPLRIEWELEVFDRLYCDFAMLSKYDMVGGKGSFLNLISEKQLIFSLINDSADYEAGPEIITGDKLISFLKPHSGRGESPSAGSFLLNYGAGPDDTDRKKDSVPGIEAVVAEGTGERDETV